MIKSCDLSFPDKSVTLIQGPSGTGKTSLLYRIGLISKDENFAYYINGKQITTSSEKETLRKLNFGYVLQDSTLFEHYDVMGNMKLMHLCWIMIIKKKIISILNQSTSIH